MLDVFAFFVLAAIVPGCTAQFTTYPSSGALLVHWQQVDNGLVIFLQSQRQLSYLHQGAKAAQDALSVALVQYDRGAFTTVLAAEQNLFAAQSNVALAASSVSLRFTAIYRALGGGWQIRQDDRFVDAATVQQMRSRSDWGVLTSATRSAPAA